ncbi:MAG: hypothetical protein VX583_14010 [Bdellovibrionota bacterium]|nr:hypothetical protein [Pseudobdellovibrionaceae bacterium]|tara:strand:+ start:34761 stop:35591 length:831 start_codon:yes stop_codon:yes gene_type:complete
MTKTVSLFIKIILLSLFYTTSFAEFTPPIALESDIAITSESYNDFGFFHSHNTIPSSLDRKWAAGFKRFMEKHFDSGLLLDKGSFSRPFHRFHGPFEEKSLVSKNGEPLFVGKRGEGKGMVAIGKKDGRLYFYNEHLELVKPISGYTEEEIVRAMETAIEKNVISEMASDHKKLTKKINLWWSAILTAAALSFSKDMTQAISATVILNVVIIGLNEVISRIMLDGEALKVFKDLKKFLAEDSRGVRHIKTRRGDISTAHSFEDLRKSIFCSKSAGG